MRDDDWTGLTDEDRRGIARIRRQLDQEFGIETEAPRGFGRWRRPLVVAAVVALSLAGGVVTWEWLPASRTTEPLRPVASIPPSDPPAEPLVVSAPPEATPAAALRDALDAWIDATRRGDIATQMTFYPEVVPVFYTWRDAPSHAVLAEKQKVLGEAWTLDIRTGPPTVTVTADGDAAVTRFRKAYVIEGPRVRRRGTVIQELRWARTDLGWKITSERDTAVPASTARRSTRPAGFDGTASWHVPATKDVSVAGQSNAP
jgi:hypothetical protein